MKSIRSVGWAKRSVPTLGFPGGHGAKNSPLRRVGEDVATLTPHRPGRADFPHPVLRGRVSLTVSKIIAIDHRPPPLTDRGALIPSRQFGYPSSFREQV